MLLLAGIMEKLYFEGTTIILSENLNSSYISEISRFQASNIRTHTMGRSICDTYTVGFFPPQHLHPAQASLLYLRHIVSNSKIKHNGLDTVDFVRLEIRTKGDDISRKDKSWQKCTY